MMADFRGFLIIYSNNESFLGQQRCGVGWGGVGWVVSIAREKKLSNMNNRVYSGYDIHN